MEFGLRLVNIGQFYRQGWLGMIQALTLPLLPVTAVFGLIIASVLWAPAAVTWTLLTAFQISSLSFLIDPILHFVIGPRIEACLDEDARMIYVRDFPEAAEAAPAPQPQGVV
jgi:Zn-dependent protease with chaperone function